MARGIRLSRTLWRAACRLSASPIPGNARPSASIPTGRPQVETITRRSARPKARGETSAASASPTAARLSRGSPMPMKTTFRSGVSASRAPCATWSRISSAVRLRAKGMPPVAQKTHPPGQPSWLDTQREVRPDSARMRTDSRMWPSSVAKASLLARSRAEARRSTSLSACGRSPAANAARRSAGRTSRLSSQPVCRRKKAARQRRSASGSMPARRRAASSAAGSWTEWQFMAGNLARQERRRHPKDTRPGGCFILPFPAATGWRREGGGETRAAPISLVSRSSPHRERRDGDPGRVLLHMPRAARGPGGATTGLVGGISK